MTFLICWLPTYLHIMRALFYPGCLLPVSAAGGCVQRRETTNKKGGMLWYSGAEWIFSWLCNLVDMDDRGNNEIVAFVLRLREWCMGLIIMRGSELLVLNPGEWVYYYCQILINADSSTGQIIPNPTTYTRYPVCQLFSYA